MKVSTHFRDRSHCGRNEFRPWKKVVPFAVNLRGVLIHRVRSAGTFINLDGTLRHEVADYWCGNSGLRVQFVADPPEDRLLCVFCEAKAIAAGELSADELAGRHVHIGRVRGVRTCCLEREGN